MENISREYLPAEKCLVNINQLNHQLLNVDSELNKPNMTSIVPSPESNDYKHACIKYSNDHKSQDDNICLESDEYDSDSSLEGSFDSLYLKLKDNPKIPNLSKNTRVTIQQLQPTVYNLSETDCASRNNEVPSLKPKNDKDAKINNSNDNKSQNDNIYFESDEYDSDCSLGSLNSLYLRLKKNSKMLNSYKTDTVSTKQLQPTICKSSKANSSPGNNKGTKTKTLENKPAYDKTEDTKPIMKLNTTLFYGKQKLSSQHNFTQLSYEQSYKQMFSKILKTRSSVSTFKYNTKKLRISSKKLKQRRRPTIQKTLSTNNIFWENKKLIRSHLKEAVPLLQFTAKCMKKNFQNNELCSWKNTDENLLRNKIEFTKDERIIKKEDESLEFSYMENELYEPNYFFMNDFTDTDDFEGTIDIENIIQTLDEDDSCFDNETHKWWKNEYDYEDQDEIQDKFCILFKEFNNF